MVKSKKNENFLQNALQANTVYVLNKTRLIALYSDMFPRHNCRFIVIKRFHPTSLIFCNLNRFNDGKLRKQTDFPCSFCEGYLRRFTPQRDLQIYFHARKLAK